MSCHIGKELENPNFYKGQRHKQWTQYYENGIKKSEQNYYCGFQQGANKFYNENGNLEFLVHYEIDEIISESEYYEDGTLKSHITYEYEDIHNESELITLISSKEVSYFENNHIKLIKKSSQKYNLKNAEISEHETNIEYFENGFIKSESTEIDYRLEGIQRTYYENGNMKSEGVFKDDQPFEKQYFYNKNGSLHRIEIWYNGKLVETQKS